MRHPLLRLLPHYRPSVPLLAAGVLGLLLGTALNLAGPVIVARAIDVDIALGDREGLLRSALAYLGVLLANVVVTYGSRLALEVAAQRAMVGLKTQIFDHLVHHDLALHDEQSSGRLVTRIQGDTDALRVLLTEVVLSAPADLALFVGMAAVMLASAPAVAPLVGAVLPIYLALFVVFRKVSPPRFLASRAVRAELTGFLTERVRGMTMLQLFDRQSWARADAEAVNARVYDTDVGAQLLPVYYFNAVFVARSLGFVLLLWAGGLRVHEGALTVGALVLGLAYMRQMFNPLMRLSHHLATIERSRAAGVRIASLLDREREIRDPPAPVPWPGKGGSLRIEGVWFHYHAGTPILRDVTIDIPAGGSVGIVGATGAGKTTILNLLLRFRDPVRGRVTVDGVDLRDLRVRDVRDHIGLVLQDVLLFPGTVLDNLGGDRERAARALATLGVETSLDMVVSESGANLSRGERQLLTFARALALDPEILVLDEATSAVDPATEARVQAAMEVVQQGRTTVVVAHRLSTVRRCDRIYVLHEGRVVEWGTHDALVAAGGIYAALAELQGAAA